MEPLDIKYFLQKKGYSQARIASVLGVTNMHVSLIVNKKLKPTSQKQRNRSPSVKTAEIMQTIGAILETPVDKVFPEYVHMLDI